MSFLDDVCACNRKAEQMADKAKLQRIKDEDAPSYCTGSAYEVRLGGKLYGVVYRTTREFSRKAGRLRYDVRQVPCWGCESSEILRHSLMLKHDSRKRSVIELFETWLLNERAPKGIA